MYRLYISGIGFSSILVSSVCHARLVIATQYPGKGFALIDDDGRKYVYPR